MHNYLSTDNIFIHKIKEDEIRKINQRGTKSEESKVKEQVRLSTKNIKFRAKEEKLLMIIVNKVRSLGNKKNLQVVN